MWPRAAAVGQPDERAPGTAAERRELAYRANNLGVGRLEQFDYDAAAESLPRGAAIEPSLAAARLNLAIALFYDGQLDAARTEAARPRRRRCPTRRSRSYCSA